MFVAQLPRHSNQKRHLDCTDAQFDTKFLISNRLAGNENERKEEEEIDGNARMMMMMISWSHLHVLYYLTLPSKLIKSRRQLL